MIKFLKIEKLRNYLFETIWEQKSIEWIVLYNYYNNNDISKHFPAELVLKAHQKLLVWIMDTEWINRNDVIHNASD